MSAVDDSHLLRRKIMGYIVSQAIFAVTELDIVEHVQNGPVPVDELAAQCGADVDALYRFLRVLTAEGLFVENPRGSFTGTSVSALLRRDAPGSLRHLVTLMSGEAYQAWGAAGHSLRTGAPSFDRVYGKPFFEWLSDDPHASAAFNEAQAGLVELRLLPLLNRDWSTVNTVVDIGGGNGGLLNLLLARNPHLRGVLFDLPYVFRDDEPALDAPGVRERCSIVGGDFFRSVPTGGQTYILAQILHDWDDDDARTILRHCRRAMASDARLLILEQVVPDDHEPHPAKVLDLHMLVLLGGKERSESAWQRLLHESGFELLAVEHSTRSAIIEARPIAT